MLFGTYNANLFHIPYCSCPIHVAITPTNLPLIPFPVRSVPDHDINDMNNEQTYKFNDNIREVMKMDFPNEMPVLRILSSETEKS